MPAEKTSRGRWYTEDMQVSSPLATAPLAAAVAILGLLGHRCLARLALRPDHRQDHRLVLLVGGVGVRQPGWLRLLHRLRDLRRARVGCRYGLVCPPPRPLAVGAVGEAPDARARSAQPAHPRLASSASLSRCVPPSGSYFRPLGYLGMLERM